MGFSLSDCKIITPTEIITPGTITISDDGKLAYIGLMENAPNISDPSVDMHGLILAPGFIDIHVHGGNGISFGRSGMALEELQAYSKWVVSTGVTGYLCSLAAPDAKSLVELVRNYAEIMNADFEGAEPRKFERSRFHL